MQDRTHRKCPYAATLWKVWVSGGFVMDGSLKVKCTTRKQFILINRFSLKILTECSTTIPSAPAGTAGTAWDGQTSVGSNVYYECIASTGSINALVDIFGSDRSSISGNLCLSVCLSLRRKVVLSSQFSSF